MSNKSDYNKRQLDLFNLLPEVLRSKTNEAVFQNIFNRYFSKSELERAVGYVGYFDNPPLINDQIKEPTPHRQAYQLQPLLYKKIGSVEHLMSFKDALKELERLGVDPYRYAEWGRTQVFNWVPPIDIDKLAHYRDYYWYDPENPASKPQYITIKSRCELYQNRVDQYENTISSYGESHTIVGIDATNNTFTIPNNLTDVFKPEFVFFIKNSTNLSVNKSFWKTESSVYIPENNVTIITVQQNISDDSIQNGTISLLELLTSFQAERDIACGGEVGWDGGQWDDGQTGALIWNTGLLDNISSPTEPFSAVGNELELWYDTTNDQLKQSNGTIWKIVQRAFSLIVAETSGEQGWDGPINPSSYNHRLQWVHENKWVHRTKVANFTIAKQAQVPILEFDDNVQLNEWAFSTHQWKYRSTTNSVFDLTTNQPSLLELIPFIVYSINGNTITLDEQYGNVTSDFPAGYQFAISNSTDNDGVYTVVSSTYVQPAADQRYVTRIVVEESFTSSTADGQIEPIVTSVDNNTWVGYNEHWIYVGITDTYPVDIQGSNPMLVIPENPVVDGPGAPDYKYTIGLSAQQFTVLVDSTITFTLDATLHDIAVAGTNQTRIYLNDVRQYGTYDEVVTTVGDTDFVTGITFNIPLVVDDIIRVELGAPASIDIGLTNVPVRLEEDDDAWILGGSPTIKTSLLEFNKVEQVKVTTNQYPLFDIFEVDGTHTNTVSSVFEYATSSTSNVNSDTGLRLVTTNNGRDFDFNQLLVDEDTGKMYAYKTDGALKTIWRAGNNAEEYIPQYVNSDREQVPVGSLDGDWEVPDPLYYNPMHENRKTVSHSQLLAHFNSIIDSQVSPPEFAGSPRQLYHLIPDPNYGLGGRIKEHNESFDTFLSTIFVDNVTPISLIEFARGQYDNAINTLKELLRRQLKDFLLDTNAETIATLPTLIANSIIEQYEENDVASLIYGDSSTYNETLGIGVRSWPATLPFLKLVKKVRPEFVKDTLLGIREIIHHDGHRSEITFTNATVESLIQQVLLSPDIRPGTHGTYGKQSTGLPPDTAIDYLTEFNGATRLLPGVYWYYVNGSNRKLYRFNVVSTGTGTPSESLPDGSYWWDSGTNTLREKNGNIWPSVTVPADGIITAAWTEIDLNDILAEVIVNVENKLYEAAPLVEPTDFAFDFALLDSEVELKSTLTSQAFSEYIHEHRITTPFVNEEYDAANAFTWNYKRSPILLYPSSTNTGTETGGIWQDLYNKLYGTPYPHLEPWKLQGFYDKPTWWDAEYIDTTGTRRWKYTHTTTTGMWENIRQGIIPVGKIAPDGTVGSGLAGQVQAYSYFSVNVSDTTVLGYNPDDLFPPYVNYNVGIVRSVFNDINSIISPSADFEYGDAGDQEWNWQVSSRYLYDQLAVAYKMQPLRFIHSTLGVDFVEVNGLHLNARTKKVYAHQDALFHGDLINDKTPIYFDGLLQWYVNYNRHTGVDSSSSNFRRLWTEWTPPLSYQFGSFIDTRTFLINNPVFGVTSKDYNILMKRTPGIDDNWIDSLKMTLVYSPPSLVSTNTDSQWKFQIDTNTPIGRDFKYYEVRRFKFDADPGSNTFTLYQYPIIDVSVSNTTFTVSGNQTLVFSKGSTFTVTGSTGNNNTYTVELASYNNTTNSTDIIVEESIFDATVDGEITANYRTLPIEWQTGTELHVSTTNQLPIPLSTTSKYFLIRLNDTQFKLAATPANARNGIAISVSSAGMGDHRIGEVESTFKALDGVSSEQKIWRRYALDKRTIQSFIPPFDVYGMQNTINVLFGHAALNEDEGFGFDSSETISDPETGRQVNWNLEIERFVDWSFTHRRTKYSVSQSFSIIANSVTNRFEFNGSTPNWGTGRKVQLVPSSAATLPIPFLANTPYYVIRDPADENKFRLAATSTDALSGTGIMILSNGTGDFSLREYVAKKQLPTFELNPFKSHVWYSHPQGVLSNMLEGPFKDIRSRHTLYDQYKRPVKSDHIRIYRFDKRSMVGIKDGIANDVERVYGVATPDPYNYLHVGGAHVFLDGYEHVILFNNYSTDGFLIYDPFVGLNTRKFNLEFDKQSDFTLRPNVGGFVLNGEGKLTENIESLVSGIRDYYDTFRVSEGNETTKFVRKTLGYDGPFEYLNQISVNPKTQFIFWRGMIQNKGSVNSVKAFINSRRFLDAQVDEFWAYKLAEFGDSRCRVYPRLKLLTTDSHRNELRFEFVETTGTATVGFEGISFESDRWVERPVQIRELEDCNTSGIPKFTIEGEITSVDELANSNVFTVAGNKYYITDVPCDGVSVTWYNEATHVTTTLNEGVDYTRINSRLVKFITNPDTLTSLKVYTINPAKSKINPAKIIDTKAGPVVSLVPIWDPARGHHYYESNHVIDIQHNSDPAEYNVSLDPGTIGTTVWNTPEIGKTWLDTTTLAYVPYHDALIFTDVTKRSFIWGDMADWGDIKLYQWTESDVPPEEWDALAVVEEGDLNIDESDRKTGRARSVLMKRISTSPDVYAPEIDQHEEFIVELVANYVTAFTGNVDVFVNGKFVTEMDASNITTYATSLNSQDFVHVIKRAHVPTEEELTNGDYVVDYPHTSITKTASNHVDMVTTYYFWVENKTLQLKNSSLSLKEAAQQLETIPIPYMIIQKLTKAEPPTDHNHDIYSQLIIKGLGSIINEDDRYVLRLTKDFTFRDDLQGLDLKGVHSEWELIRQEQNFNIPRSLWNKVTESIVGYSLDDSSIKLPYIEHVLYDERFGTDTRYGLREGQVFVDGTLAKDTILAYLTDKANDFTPIDIDDFFTNHNFDTVENIEAAMNTIYNTFNYEHVNRLFFSVLMDALTLKRQYPDIFKTSLISLHGIKLFETAGLFDD